MNKSIKKCCICSNSETGEFIMIGDNKYHLSCIEKMQKENQQLKEQLEDMTLCRDIASGHRKEVQDRETILLNQQKEFMKLLENKIDILTQGKETFADLDKGEAVVLMELAMVLEEYKEIIGDKDEN